MGKNINYNVFYVSNDGKKIIRLNSKGYIITAKNIKIKNPKGRIFKHKTVLASQIYSKSILDVYPMFFQYGLDNEHNKKVVEHYKEIENSYEIPKLKPLTKEQIDDIHKRGKITPREKVKEWEDMDLCAPGDYAGSAKCRCDEFKNCHNCLVDYANMKDEYTSFKDILIGIREPITEEEKGQQKSIRR